MAIMSFLFVRSVAYPNNTPQGVRFDNHPWTKFRDIGMLQTLSPPQMSGPPRNFWKCITTGVMSELYATYTKYFEEKL